MNEQPAVNARAADTRERSAATSCSYPPRRWAQRMDTLHNTARGRIEAARRRVARAVALELVRERAVHGPGLDRRDRRDGRIGVGDLGQLGARIEQVVDV